ncbi:hypothetical protein KDW_27820 [Dictyobacter vulcani]|uniref:Uncharacterized protein n=1 Tax=Dictyobacter vulcani TaxID=2607529 RepID=A0A5J4KQC0_9CHLR|nr:hypothetical protein [Dictyobacter vulcani]GER88620.1 hypothetical protein KDW_27820 [Dictyobacter vulcani]
MSKQFKVAIISLVTVGITLVVVAFFVGQSYYNAASKPISVQAAATMQAAAVTPAVVPMAPAKGANPQAGNNTGNQQQPQTQGQQPQAPANPPQCSCQKVLPAVVNVHPKHW